MKKADQARISLDSLRSASGDFVMLALDQRESLRTMMSAGKDGVAVSDEDLSDFKTSSAIFLTPKASAVLLDRQFGLTAAAESKCAVILAADILHQMPGGPVTGASVDPGITPDLVRSVGARALKMLVPWLPDRREEAVDLAAEFMGLCRKVGVAGIVEGVVRPSDIGDWADEERNDAIVLAATDLKAVRPDLYKAEVPSYGRGTPEDITKTSRRITAALDCEWVVLSSGVSAKDFPASVEACVKGGASGFLAGRAVWADALNAPDVDYFLREESANRLDLLLEAVMRAKASQRRP